MLIGLIVIADRYTDGTTQSSPATDASTPAWYGTIAPLLPERFPYVALTLATDAQLWFVALARLMARLSRSSSRRGGYSTEATTMVDGTGVWVETAQGWSVRTPSGLFVSVSCDIGVRGRDFAGPPNYCDMASTGTFSKTEIRSVANALATSLTTSIFDQSFGPPKVDTIDPAAATALIAAAIPDQQQISDTDWGQGGSDHVYDFSLDPARPDTSVRILHGVYPTSVVTEEPSVAVYDGAAPWAAVVWMFGTGGVVVRISTTDPSPASATRLEQLARDLMKLDPTAAKSGTTPSIYTGAATTTTTMEPLAAVDAATSTSSSTTTTTVASCGQSGAAPTVVVVNASHVVGTAAWWTGELAGNVPSVDFADPLNALAKASSSRVLALSGYECEASLVAGYTAVANIEPATIESLQSLVAEPLPAGTAVVVLIGDDNMSRLTVGATTTTLG